MSSVAVPVTQQSVASKLRSLMQARRTVAVYSALLLLIVLLVYFMPLPYSPLTPNASISLQAPSREHWFGTDTIGRDIFSRTFAAGRTDLPLALGGTFFALLTGVSIGLLVSVKSKWSEYVMRGVDTFQAFPLLVLAIALVSLAGNRLSMVVVAIALIFAPLFIRLVRSEALAIREARYIEAAYAIGATRRRVVLQHVLPNVTGIILVQTALTASMSLIAISALSFLGVGVSPPTASWGAMIQTGSEDIVSGQWWVAMFPGLAVCLCVFLFHQLGDAIDQVLRRGARG